MRLKENIRVIPLKMTRTISPISDLRSLWNFYRLCKREKPHIVHSHTPKAGIIGMLGAKLAGVPIRLHTVAGLPLMEANGIKRKILVSVEKLTYYFATKVYPNSQGLYSYILKERYIKPEKIHVIANGSSNGIDTTHFSSDKISDESKKELKTVLAIQETDFVFVYVGRLVGDKGINEMVSAFSKLQSEVPYAKLLLVGWKEDMLDPLKPETAQTIDNNPNIMFVGYQADVRPYFAISDCLVFPSYREGFPNGVMQAGAMGLPCIVSDINGCNEIIIKDKNGIIIPPKDIDAIKIAMQKMMIEKDKFQIFKSNARKMIVERYENKFVWEALLEEYNSLLKYK